MTAEGKRKRRRVVVLSEADKKLLAEGEAVAWDAVSVREISMVPVAELKLSPRDKQIAGDVPPHY
ncbi:hypothetical protein HMPREF0044_1535 [Gleimia coleocanis DSM 15436]|uniref:Uncharacterized protein n=1 Tax=Gleimia coleocanis DSM 15436 TaxID=525245 RepID=C0W282_9ACTO|nr:hypothetical protein [Gleimia coleocanis]EEH63296.1 hypothetical protein HMPREF0044_1535 [Gleimia coleocanis DSM 15436]